MLKYLLLIVAIAAVSAHASEAPAQNATTPQNPANATAPPTTPGFEVNTSVYQIPDIVDKKNNTHADPCHCVKHPCDCLNNTVTVQIRSDVVGGGSVKVLKNLSDPASVVAPPQNKSAADAANPLVIQKLETTPAAATSTLTYSPPINGGAAPATTGGVPTASLSTLSTNNGGILNPNASYLYTNVDVKAKVDAAVAEHVQRKATVTSAITQTAATAEDLKAKLDAIRAKIADVQAQTRGIKENVKQIDQVHEKKKRRVIRKISATRETLVQETNSHTQVLEVARRNLRKELKASREAREVALRQAEASKAAVAAAKAATAAHGGRAQRLKAATAAAKRAADQADLQQKKIAQRQREKQRKFEQAMKNEQIKAELMEKAHEKKVAAYKQKLLLLKQSLDRVRKHVQDHKRVKSEVELKLWKAKHLAEKRRQRLRRMRDRLNKKLVRLVKRISFHRNQELSHRQQYQRKLQQIKFFLEHMKTVSADNGDELKRMKVQLHKLLEQARTLKNLQVNDARHAATLAQLTGYQTAEHRLLTVENLSQLASVKAQVHNIRHSAQQNYVKLRAKALAIWRSKMVSLRHAFQKLIETRKRILKEQKQHRKLFKATAKLNRKIINGMRHLYFLRSKLAKQKRYAYWRMRFNKFRAHLEWLNRVRNKYREALKLPAVPMDLSKIRIPADRLKTYRQSLEHLNGKIKLASQQFRASRKALANAQSLRAFNSLKGQFLARYRYFRRLSDERNHILREMGRAPKHFTASSTLPVPTLVRKNKWRLKFLNKTINSLTRYMRRLLFQGRKTFRRSLWERTKKAYDNARVRLLSLHRKRVSAQRKLHVRRTQLKVQHFFPPFAGRFMEKAHKFHTDQANKYYSRYVTARKTYFRLYRSGRLGSWQSGRLSSFSVRARNGFARYVFHRRAANRYAKKLGLGQKPIVAQKKLPNWRARYRSQVAKYRASAQKRQLVQSKKQRAALTNVWKRREAAFKRRRARYNRRLNKRAARYRKALRACKTPSCTATYKARLVRINRNRRAADRIFRKHWSKYRGCVSAKCRVARNKKLSQRLKKLRSKVRRVRKVKRVVFNKAKAKAAALKRKQRAALRKKRRAARRQKRRLRRLRRRLNRRRRKAIAKKRIRRIRRRGGKRRRGGRRRRRRRGGKRRRGGRRRRRRRGGKRRRGGRRRRRRRGGKRRRGGRRRRRRRGGKRRRGGRRRRRRRGGKRRRGGRRRRRRRGGKRRRGAKRRRRIARRRAKKAARRRRKIARRRAKKAARRRRRIARRVARRRRIAARKASRAAR